MTAGLHTGLYYANLVLAGVAAVLGLLRWRKAGKTTRIFAALIIVAFLGELLAWWSAIRYGNNNAVYNLFDVMQFTILCLYFNETIAVFRKKAIGFWLAGISIGVWAFNYLLYWDPGRPDKVFLLYEGLSILCMCVLLQVQLYDAEGVARITSFAHFWLSTALMLYWASNLLNWQMMDRFGGEGWQISLLLPLVTNIITFVIFGMVFLKLPKLQTSP